MLCRFQVTRGGLPATRVACLLGALDDSPGRH